MHNGTSRLSARAIAVAAVAFVVFSCKSKLGVSNLSDISNHPVQTIEDMFIDQTDKGNMNMYTTAPVMERYQNDTLSWEEFPKGFTLFAYTESGQLETEIKADMARHTTQNASKKETWAAFGNVLVKNLIKNETMETDTLYWDKEGERIYTDCYVKMYSPSGFMQGYGMESDQRGRNSVLLRPFNTYGILDSDSTRVVIDSVNFIGPFQKKEVSSQVKMKIK